jgi:hypothetical protein
MSKLIDIPALPDEHKDELLKKVADIIDNGSRLPADVTNELIFAALMRMDRRQKEIKGCVSGNRQWIQRLGVAIGFVAVVIGVLHGEEVLSILGAIP